MARTTSRVAADDYQVLTPERVSLRYDLAGVGSRTAAALVDSAIQFVALLVLGLAMLAVAAIVSVSGLTLGRWFGPTPPGGPRDVLFIVIGVFLIVLFFAITWGYYFVFEIVWNGQTPGKRALGLRVIRDNGYPLRASDAVVRNLLRIVDSFTTIGLVVMLLNNQSKRLGDFAAGTVVVREGTRHRPLATLAPDPPAPSAGAVTLRPEDATLVRDFLMRRASMEPAPRAALAARLATLLSRRYALDHFRPHNQSDETFLETLLAEA